jgi:energy-coupling factor transport system ATP-binding protein
VIEVAGVRVEREGATRAALDDVSFAVAPGERVALLGGNGSGKTTLLRLLNGTELPARGSVRVAGYDTADSESYAAVRRAAGLLFQDPDNQFVSTTAAREIAFGLENLCRPTAEIRAEVDAAVAQFGLESLRDVPPHEMSGGEKARLALASVWVMRPRALLLDEIHSLLDRDGRARLAGLLAALPPETILVHATTEANVAASYARVLVLHEGRLVADGVPDAVFASLPEAVKQRTGMPESSAHGGGGALLPPPPSDAAAAVLVRAHEIEARWNVFGRPGPLVLDRISLDVRAGDRVGLTGASGSGKSTLFAVWCGLLRPQRGRVEWPAAAPGKRQVLPSLVFQFPERQLFAERVRDDVAYGLKQSGVPAGEIVSRVDAALEAVGLPPGDFADRMAFHLSGGEQRRVALAGVLAQQRQAVLLDEPTLGLDHEGIERLVDLMQRLHARGIATWSASHDERFVARTCDRIVMLEHGRVQFDGAGSAADRTLVPR